MTLILFALLVALMTFSLMLGRYPLSSGAVLGALSNIGGAHPDVAWVVVVLLRLPRILTAALCGMGLALTGAVTQGVFHNPLVSPDIAGVSAGAAFGGVLAILLGLPPVAQTGMAFGFGLGAMIVAFGLSRLGKIGGSLGLVLAGIVVGAFFSALIGLMEYLAEPQLQLSAMVYWLLGSFVGATYQKVMIIACVLLVAGGVLMLMRWRLNLLSLNEIDATALGVPVVLLRWGCLGLVALIVAAQVSVSGGVGWVGLVVPHLARMMVGPDHTRLLPASALLGSLYLLVMDDLARSIGSQEIPIGLLTATIGAPVFGVLFWRLGSRGWTSS